MSLAKIVALVYGFIGFFIALGVAVTVMANIIVQKDFAGSVIVVTLFNIGAGLILAVLSSLAVAIFGWLIGFVIAGVYNWFAKKAGGIKIELAEVEESKKDDISK